MPALTLIPTGSEPDSFVCDALKKLKDQFFSSLEDGGSLLSLFQSSWTAFHERLESLQPYLKSDTLEMVDSFASTVAAVVSSLLELDSSTTRIYQEFTADLSHLLDDAIPSTSSNTPSKAPSPSPNYIEPALKWLKENIHNPYPTRAIRNALARKTKTSTKDIDAWFVDIRKRIGWSRMRCSRFNNRKAEIVDAAERFFNNSDPYRPLEDLLQSEFAAISYKVEQLYSERYGGSVLASRLDGAVKDLTLQMKQAHQDQRRYRRSEDRDRSHRRYSRPYPTPDRSPASSPEPFGTPESIIIELPTSNLGKKRSRSASEFPSDSEGQQRPVKRIRNSSKFLDIEAHKLSLPSPASSIASELSELPIDGPNPALDLPLESPSTNEEEWPSNAEIAAPHLPASALSEITNSTVDSFDWFSELFQCDPSLMSNPGSNLTMPFDPSVPLEIELMSLAPYLETYAGASKIITEANGSCTPGFVDGMETFAPLSTSYSRTGASHNASQVDDSWLGYCIDDLSPSSPSRFSPMSAVGITDTALAFQSNTRELHDSHPRSPQNHFWLSTQYSQPQLNTNSSFSSAQPISKLLELTTTSEVLNDKARELLQLEAQCQALRAELAAEA